MPTRKLMTLHAPLAGEIAKRFMEPATELLDMFGTTWWLSTQDLPDITIMVACEQEWCERGATQRELDEFFRLWNAGEKDAAREMIRTGLPPYMR